MKDYRSVQEAIHRWRSDFEFDSRERLHQALNYQTPETVYRQGRKCAVAATLHGWVFGLDSWEHFRLLVQVLPG